MKNRSVGILMMGASALIGFIVFIFNRALSSIVREACSHGSDCPMWETIGSQTKVGVGIMMFVMGVGLYLIFSREEATGTPGQITRKPFLEDYETIMAGLGNDERLVLERVIAANGTVFQSEIVEGTKFAKAKITRILDRLEAGGLIERRRRGMANVVILKQQ